MLLAWLARTKAVRTNNKDGRKQQQKHKVEPSPVSQPTTNIITLPTGSDKTVSD
jgi:hypothetical protein